MTNQQTILLLQGGGALGAYQCGAIEGLEQAGTPPDWVAGISIGAINAALLAGNAPAERVPALRRFWERISAASAATDLWSAALAPRWLNLMIATRTIAFGAPGFFRPCCPGAALLPPGTPGARSFYDTAPLRDTLLELVDFERINTGPMRLSVGAVNVATGNMTWFDSASTRITPEHIMASGALPPGFPAIEIDGAYYWDGGLVSNTPLQYVLEAQDGRADLTIYQIDLWNARGERPDSVWTSDTREMEIRFSSRTRMATDLLRDRHELHQAARRLAKRLPPELQSDPDLRRLMAGARDPRLSIAHLIYRQNSAESGSRDYEFSRRSMEAHWQAGATDARKTLDHPSWQSRATSRHQIETFDLSSPDSLPERTDHESRRRPAQSVFDAAEQPRLSKGTLPLH